MIENWTLLFFQIEYFRSNDPGHWFKKFTCVLFKKKKSFIILFIFLSCYFNLMIWITGLLRYYRLARSYLPGLQVCHANLGKQKQVFYVFFFLFCSFVFNRLWIKMYCVSSFEKKIFFHMLS